MQLRGGLCSSGLGSSLSEEEWTGRWGRYHVRSHVERLSIMQRLNLFVAVVALLAGTLIALVRREPQCEQRTLYSAVPSPAGNWVAQTYFNVCGSGAVGTDASSTVEIMATGKPTKSYPVDSRIVLSIDSGRGTPIATLWASDEQLKVVLSRGAVAAIKKQGLSSVEVTYDTYDSSDRRQAKCVAQMQAQGSNSLSIPEACKEWAAASGRSEVLQ